VKSASFEANEVIKLWKQDVRMWIIWTVRLCC